MDKSDIGVLSDIGVSRLFDTDILHEIQPLTCFSPKAGLPIWLQELSAKKTASARKAAPIRKQTPTGKTASLKKLAVWQAASTSKAVAEKNQVAAGETAPIKLAVGKAAPVGKAVAGNKQLSAEKTTFSKKTAWGEKADAFSFQKQLPVSKSPVLQSVPCTESKLAIIRSDTLIRKHASSEKAAAVKKQLAFSFKQQLPVLKTVTLKTVTRNEGILAKIAYNNVLVEWEKTGGRIKRSGMNVSQYPPYVFSPPVKAYPIKSALRNILQSAQVLKYQSCAAPSSGSFKKLFENAGGSTCCGQKVLAPLSLSRTFLCSSPSLARFFPKKSKLYLFGFGSVGSTIIRRACTFCGSLSGIGIFECHIIFLRLGKEIFRLTDSDHTFGEKRQNILAINRIFRSTGNNTEQTECDFFRCGCCIDSCRSYRVNNGHSFSFVFHQSLDEIVKQLVVFIKAIATAIFKPVILTAFGKRLCLSAPFFARAGQQKSNRIFKSIVSSATKVCLSAKSVTGKIKDVTRKSEALALQGGSVFEAVFSPELSEFFARQLCGQPTFFKAEKRVL